MYAVNINEDELTDALIEGYLKSHPDDSVEDALENIFQAGVRALTLYNLECALAQRNAEVEKMT